MRDAHTDRAWGNQTTKATVDAMNPATLAPPMIAIATTRAMMQARAISGERKAPLSPSVLVTRAVDLEVLVLAI
ncbi:hypothetical protein GCM10009720_16270 [Yaniella flava]|uniref:Uncharacterized protein n=1 Tax=Yaniella flava TaxID=287930 RepID=A0ABN2UFD6_9MICC